MPDVNRRVKVTQEGTLIPEGFDPGCQVEFIDRKADDKVRHGRVESVGNRELLITEDGTKQMYVVLWEDAKPGKGAPPRKKGGPEKDPNAAAQTTLT